MPHDGQAAALLVVVAWRVTRRGVMVTVPSATSSVVVRRVGPGGRRGGLPGVGRGGSGLPGRLRVLVVVVAGG